MKDNLISQRKFLENFKIKDPISKRLIVSISDSVEFIDLDKIIRIGSDGRYSIIFLSDKKKIMVTKNLGEFEKILNNYGFIRIHNSHLINKLHIIRFLKREGGDVEMSDHAIIPVSKSGKIKVQLLLSEDTIIR